MDVSEGSPSFKHQRKFALNTGGIPFEITI